MGALWSISEILSKIKANLNPWILRLNGCDHNIRAILLDYTIYIIYIISRATLLDYTIYIIR